SMTSDLPSSSTRRRSFPKLARASRAVTIIPSFINSPFRLIKLYSSGRVDVNNRFRWRSLLELIRKVAHSHVGQQIPVCRGWRAMFSQPCPLSLGHGVVAERIFAGEPRTLQNF